MDNKIQNIVLRVVMVVMIGLGAIMTYWVATDDNPSAMNPEEHAQWAKAEWNEWISNKGKALTEKGGLRKITKNDKRIDDNNKIVTKENDTLPVVLYGKIVLDGIIDNKSGLDKEADKDSIEVLKAEILSALKLEEEGDYLGFRIRKEQDYIYKLTEIKREVKEIKRELNKIKREGGKDKEIEKLEKALEKLEEAPEKLYAQKKKELLEEAKSMNKAFNKERLNDPLYTPQVVNWLAYRTEQIVKNKERILYDDVSRVIGFTRILLFIAVLLIAASFVYLITIDYIKALKILAGILALFVLMIICYFIASDQVPFCLEYNELVKLEPCQNPNFTPENWKIASAAILTTLVLTFIAVLAWISGPIMKLFR